ncbi:MAG: hypothetical protein J7L69_02475 [Desulfobulbaceae bacterium]|nr:hypothetical protein [Desulfobulbaceae bacterium]
MDAIICDHRGRISLRLFSTIPDRPVLSRSIVAGEGIEESELRPGIRKRNVVKARKIFCQIAVRKMDYSGAEVDRFLGVRTSAVNRSAVSEELPDLAKYL